MLRWVVVCRGWWRWVDSLVGWSGWLCVLRSCCARETRGFRGCTSGTARQNTDQFHVARTTFALTTFLSRFAASRRVSSPLGVDISLLRGTYSSSLFSARLFLPFHHFSLRTSSFACSHFLSICNQRFLVDLRSTTSFLRRVALDERLWNLTVTGVRKIGRGITLAVA